VLERFVDWFWSRFRDHYFNAGATVAVLFIGVFVLIPTGELFAQAWKVSAFGGVIFGFCRLPGRPRAKRGHTPVRIVARRPSPQALTSSPSSGAVRPCRSNATGGKESPGPETIRKCSRPVPQ